MRIIRKKSEYQKIYFRGSFPHLIKQKIKKNFLIYMIGIFALSNVSYAQLNDGKYTFSNDELTFSFETSDGGWVISYAKITVKKSNKTYDGKGEWFKVNPNGVDEEYSGPLGWYQLQINDCVFEFDEPIDNSIFLSSSDCIISDEVSNFKLNVGLQKTQPKNEKNLKIDEASDYYQMIDAISIEFDSWLKQGEFEKKEDYTKRLEMRELKFIEICDEIVKNKLAEEVAYVSGENWYQDNSGKESFVLYNYNPDKEFFPFYFRYKQIEFHDTIHIPFSDAEQFKEQTGYYSISYSKKRQDYLFANYYLYPSKIIFPNVNKKKPIEVSLNFASPIKAIQFGTDQLNLTNYSFEKIQYDFQNFKQRKSEILIVNARKYEERGDLENALILFSSILEFDKNSEVAKSKIESITKTINEQKRDQLIFEADQLITKGNHQDVVNLLIKANEIRFSEDIKIKIDDLTFKINEIKRDQLIRQAKDLYSNGKLSLSVAKYKEAINLRQTQEINNTISEIEKELNHSLKNHAKLDSIFKLVSSDEYELFKDIVKQDQLNLIKDGYGMRYGSCVNTLYKKLGAIWEPLSNEYVSISSFRNKEVWSEEYQTLLNNMMKFDQTFKVYKVFEQRIYKALMESDKKYLKVLKQDDDNEIIETVIKTEN
ncbi:MAG: hypothetical protein RL308_3249 [Bacteroidota bacterium]|jgi:hypothetical protein